MSGLGSLKKVSCKNDINAKEGDLVMIEMPNALEGLNAFIFFLPAILSLIIFMTARTFLPQTYNWYILAGTLVLFFAFRFIADKVITARTHGEFSDSKIIKIIK